jgi:hypothetical protein
MDTNADIRFLFDSESVKVLASKFSGPKVDRP